MVNLPIVNAPYLSGQGLELTITGNTTMTMASGQARNSSNESDIILDSLVTLDAANNGLNGIDTGVLVLSSLYAVYVVGDSSYNNPSGCVLSANLSTPLLPVGYDMYRLIGYVRTDASVHFLPGYFSGSFNDRTFVYDVPIATAITAGASATFAPVLLTTFVPSVNNILVNMEIDWTANAAGDTLEIQPFNAVGDTAKYIAGVAGGTAHTLVREYLMAQLDTGVPKMNYKVSAGTVALNVAGYKYSI